MSAREKLKIKLEKLKVKDLRQICDIHNIQSATKKVDLIEHLLYPKKYRVESVITITCGDVAENHVGMKHEGVGVLEGQGFNFQDMIKAIVEFKKLGCKLEIFHLNKLIKEKAQDAYILIIRGGLKVIIGDENVNDFYKRLNELEWDKKYWDTRRQKVLNKHARWNLIFGDEPQTANYEEKKGTIIAYQDIPLFCKIMQSFEKLLGKKAVNLKAEGNKYYDKSCTGIGYHGDSERRKVIAFRLGGDMPLHYQWFLNSKPIGENKKFIINSGDIYVMSEKAVGTDWKRKKFPTLRHAAGCKKYTKI